MTDYIKREDAIEELKKYFIELDEEQDEFTRPAATIAANAIVNNIPTADVRENVKGEWIENNGVCRCSVCGEEVLWSERIGSVRTDFCPNCGAQMMRGEA